MSPTSSNTNISNDPTLVPGESLDLKTNESEGTRENNIRYKILFTSRPKSEQLTAEKIEFENLSTIVPFSIGQGSSSHHDTTASLINAQAFKRIMTSNFDVHPTPNEVKFPAGTAPSDYGLIRDCYEKAQAKYVESELTRVYDAWSNHGKNPLYFDQEYIEPEIFACIPTQTMHQ